jgi:3-oxoacyl-[acyl-carrier protein] reductase
LDGLPQRWRGEIGERAFAVPGDVAADGVPDEIARRTLERFERIDILVNNAALPLSTRFPDLTAEEWRRAIEVNLTAPFLMTKAVLPAMRAQHYGRIINISSSAGRMVSTLGGAHYTASKAGKFGITVNAVCPGMIDTELTANMPRTSCSNGSPRTIPCHVSAPRSKSLI